MHPLYQRLKELDQDTFERFCGHLLKERHPGIEIRHVEGKGGDEGIDFFAGDLAQGPTVWQSKAFPDGVRAVQKRQIRESLSTALRSCSPRKWILCIDVDLDARGVRWYEELKRQYDGTVELGLLQASDIVPHLAHYRTLREEFFPGAQMDVVGLRSLMTGTADITDAELEALTEESLDQFLLRLKDRDARFNYEIRYARDPVSSPPISEPGEVFSFSKGSTTVKGFARDVEALRLAPPMVTLKLQGGGVSKFMRFVNTGEHLDLIPGEIVSVSTDLPMKELMAEDPAGLTMQMAQTFRSHEPIALRLVFGRGANAVVYEYIAFRFKRIGKEECELVSTTELPFTMSMVISRSRGSFHFTEHVVGAEVRAIRKFIDAIHAVVKTGFIECFALELGQRLFQARTAGVQVPRYWNGGYESLVRDAAAVAAEFDVKLCLPANISESDVEALQTLDAIMTGNPVSIGLTTLEFVKSPENTDSIHASLARGIADDLRINLISLSPVLFGVTVPVGPTTVEIGRVPIQDSEEARKQWLAADIGDSIRLAFGPCARATLRRPVIAKA